MDGTSHLFSVNTQFVEEMQKKYMQDSGSVEKSWAELFKSLGPEDFSNDVVLPSWKKERVDGQPKFVSDSSVDETAEKVKSVGSQSALFAKAINLINAYREHGYTKADVNPLGIKASLKQEHEELAPWKHGIDESELDEFFDLSMFSLGRTTIRRLIGFLEEVYCGYSSVEYMHIHSTAEREWIQNAFEKTKHEMSLSPEERKNVLGDILEISSFENFLHTKFPGAKRFSGEGCEASVIIMEELLRSAPRNGVEECFVGMAHRGRLSVLTKVFGKEYVAMLSEFQGNCAFPEELGLSCDVKYHLGFDSVRTVDGRTIKMNLASNPSHLEAVGPVLLGKIKARCDILGDEKYTRILGISMHGNASFCGQGVVGETLNLYNVPGYSIGGTFHIISNNQVGFTTNPEEGSSVYTSDIAKGYDLPVFHVNADDLEEAVLITRIADEYRRTFKKDVVVDVLGYRRYGHNEGDEPRFTQPVLYSLIDQHEPVDVIYGKRLTAEGLVSADYIEGIKKGFFDELQKAYDSVSKYKPKISGKFVVSDDIAKEKKVETGVEAKTLLSIADKLYKKLGSALKMNPKIEKIMSHRYETIKSSENLDWGTGEALAFGSLLSEGYDIRIAGQDSGRGTFAHRHAFLVDAENDNRHMIFSSLSGKKSGNFNVFNTTLSEFAAMGVEYGYSLIMDNSLTIWEAQFGDFVNGAQIIIDQFLCSSEQKWMERSNLILLLPHGYEGQGPEHSSGRIERFLQLCAEDNMRVVNCTTPANFFHVLRRQMKADIKKPLIVFTPKSLLRHKKAVSGLKDMSGSFKTVIQDTIASKSKKVRKLVLCSGKVYYDILELFEKDKVSDVAVVRVEQVYPFPSKAIEKELEKYKGAEVVWCQEEHKNMGMWSFVEPRLNEILQKMGDKKLFRVSYVGRAEAAAASSGYSKRHTAELSELHKDLMKK